MVFESLVTDLINKYLGDYVENLDRSQLKLGIWGGDVVLANLDLKESALDDLDLPVKIKAGHIGKLTLKIPWKNLYKEPVIATVDGIYALAVPNFAIQYNAAKEEKALQESKQKKLQQIEEAKRLEAEKNKPKEPQKDSFAEKMATQIIKNLQIHVKNIHVRYEDSYTNPKNPFSIGITLQELLFQTTDENWKPCILKEAVTQIYKLVRLDSLAVYWNSQTACFGNLHRDQILEKLKTDIASKDKKTQNQYIIKPISLVSHLRLNTKPESNNYNVPKVYLTVVFDDIAVQLSKNQYTNLLEMLDSLERMQLRGMFRKYRPTVPLHQHAKTWWHYSMTSVLEEYIRRRHRMWSWEHMNKHRKLMKQYREAYVKKLSDKKIPADVQKVIDECEKALNVFSITLMRQQAEVEAAKLGAQRQKEKEERGWFGGLFGGGKKQKAAKETEDIQDQFKELYTAEEKAKLYNAIGYQENEADPTLPKDFVAVKFVTKLSNITFTLKDDSKQVPLLMKLLVKDMFASFGQRPAANAIQLEARLVKFTVSGVQQNGVTPKLVLSQSDEETHLPLLNVQMETNPLEGACDTFVRVNAQPLQIVYDAVTVNNLAEFFKPPQEIYLQQLSQSAVEAFEQIKEQSATGLQHAIDQRKYTDISLDIKAPFIIIPHRGFYRKDCKMLVVDLGNLKVSSEKNQSSSNVKGQIEAVEELMKRAYDKFNIQVDRVQLMFTKPGQDWQSSRKVGRSDMHILEPISISICLQKCMFDKDPRMAKMKVSGELPLLSLSMSDARLQEILQLIDSIPLPESSPPDETLIMTSTDIPSTDLNANQLTKVAIATAEKELERSVSKEVANYTDLELTFEIKEVCISLSQQDEGQLIPILKLVVESLGTQVKMRTFDMRAEAYLGGIYLQYQKEKATESLITKLKDAKYQVISDGPLINIINTPSVEEQQKLLTVEYVKANTDGPEFDTTYKKTEQTLTVTFTALEVLLHKDAILSVIAFADKLKPAEKPEVTPPLESSTDVKKGETTTVQQPAKTTKPTGKSKKKGTMKDPEIIDIKVNAQLQQVGLAICTKTSLLTDVKVKGIEAEVTIQEAKTSVSAMLKAVTILDPDPTTLYPKIMEIQGEAVLKLALMVYNGATEGDKYGDMSCVDTSVGVTLGCIHVVFLFKFVNDLQLFLADFQDAFEAQVKKAGETISEYSSDALAKLQEKAPRVALDIHMDAPLIVVPQNSKSFDMLVADFGELKIKNSFQLAGKTSPSGVPAVLDIMEIKLMDMKLIRAVKLPDGGKKGECLILEPVSISLGLTRNISASWYFDKPEIDVSGKMDAVVASMSQGDFTMVMKLLNENLTEGQTQGQGQLAIEDTKSKTQRDAEDATRPKDTTEEVTPHVQGQTTPAEIHSKVKFSFKMTSLCAALYTGDSDLETGTLSKRNAANCLGKVELQVIALDGEVKSDSAIVTKVILKDTILDDLRPQKKNGVTRLIERQVSDKQGESNNMIDVSFTQDNNQNKDIDVKVSSLYICVCLDYLMSLANFFKMPDSKTPPSPPSTTTASAADKPKVPSQAPVQGEMKLRARMDKPEILLIEDQSNPSSNALKLNVELNFSMYMSPEKQQMQGQIKDLEIFTCVFNKRQVKGTQILNPCEVSFHSSTPQGQGAHMDVQTTDLIVNISPATIRLMSQIAAGLSTPKEEEGEKKVEKIPPDLLDVKKLTDTDFWFLKTPGDDAPPSDTALAGIEDENGRTEQKPESSNMFNDMKLIAKVPSIVVKLEGGVGHRTVPLLIVESSFQGEVKDWSSKLCVESSLKLEVAYYNEKLTVWEPLIEPVVSGGKRRPWELGVDVFMNDDLPPPEEDEVSDAEVINLPPPKMSINVHSQDSLEMTMSKTCLEVLNNLGKAFNEAYQLIEPADKSGLSLSPYVINNATGIEMVMKLDNSFEMPEDANNGKVIMHPTRQLHLFNRKQPYLSRKASVIKATQEGEEKKIIFQVEQFGATREATIKRAEKRFYHINHISEVGDKWAIVVSTETNIGQRIISLASIVQVKNHLSQTVELYNSGNGKVELCGSVMPGESFNVPLTAVYTSHGNFFFRPADTSYRVSKEPIGWRAAGNLGTKQISCEGESGSSPYFISVRPEVEQIYYEEGDSLSAKSYIFHLCPTAILHNLLPFPIKFILSDTDDEIKLDKGENMPLHNACIGKSTLEIIIPSYKGQEWVGKRTLQADVPELSMCTFEAYVGAQKTTMDLGVHCKQTAGCMDISVYSPYWMINKTGQRLTYKGSDSDVLLEHHHDNDEAVLFAFKQKAIFTKKKTDKHTVKSALAEPAFLVNTTLRSEDMQHYRQDMHWKEGKNNKDPDKKKVREWKQSGKASLKIGDTDWSDKFSLDTVGSSGTVQCKSKGRIYEVGVKIYLSGSALTKICTFTPYYLLLNTTEFPLMCTEVTPAESWFEIQQGECQPFWPTQTGKEISMKVKIHGSNEQTSPFLVNKSHTTLMRLDNEVGAINMQCHVNELSMVTTFSEYKHGMASVQVVNHTQAAPITFHQNGIKAIHLLNPAYYMMYTWENPMGKREILWSCGEKKEQKNDLIQDGIGDFFLNSDTKVYWVSFLDGMQRVLLFTEDLVLATFAQQAGELERIEQEINLCIQGLGLSLVNDYVQKEIAYLGITSSGVIWEEKKKRFKALNIKTSKLLEDGYQKFVMNAELGHNYPARLSLDSKLEVDFSEMMMYKPNKRTIRRSFQEGVCLRYKTSPHQVQVHAIINRLQLDSQLSGAVFPTVLSPVPLPKSVAAESVPKPFTEVSVMLRKHEHSNMLQFKYFKVLVQEMQLKVDQGFLNHIIDLFSSSQDVSREQETKNFNADCDNVKVKLMDEIGLSLAEEQTNFYDYLHFSPIKIHLSFSLQSGGGDGKPTQLHANVINVFLQSVGVVLTDVQDVVFKLGFFQKEHMFYNQSQLVGEMGRHYAGQAIKQMYVLVLGLDVLGNPFGLIRGVAEGIEDLFYEPYQGAIQGPEEFAEGLALGVRSLFGHAVGGAAGAVSRITGTLGKGLAALTLDDEYQKKRREQLNKRPANVREGFARGGKGLVMGVFDGVTGIVRKPIEGAKKEGVEGFFKGVGKGLVGAVTRPTSGVIDFASSSFEGIKRIAELSDEIQRLRPPRRFQADRIIRPYNRQEAEGYAILSETEKGKFVSTDEYMAHLVLSKDGKHVFIVTDKRVIFANRGEIFGHWDADWSYTWLEMKERPKLTQKGIEIILKEKEKKKFLFGSSTAKKEVAIPNQKLAQMIFEKISEAMAKSGR